MTMRNEFHNVDNDGLPVYWQWEDTPVILVRMLRNNDHNEPMAYMFFDVRDGNRIDDIQYSWEQIAGSLGLTGKAGSKGEYTPLAGEFTLTFSQTKVIPAPPAKEIEYLQATEDEYEIAITKNGLQVGCRDIGWADVNRLMDDICAYRNSPEFKAWEDRPSK